MTNNFEIISKKLMTPEFFRKISGDEFWQVELIKRHKDNPEMENNEYHFKNYSVKGPNELKKLMPEIILLCEAMNARAYISIVKKSESATCKGIMADIANRVAKGDILPNPNRIVASQISKNRVGSKKFLIDVDDISVSGEQIKQLVALINSCRNDDRLKKACRFEFDNPGMHFIKRTGNENDSVYDNAICVVPTKNGCHVISYAFNKEQFNNQCMELFGKTFDIHENNITLLYENIKNISNVNV